MTDKSKKTRKSKYERYRVSGRREENKQRRLEKERKRQEKLRRRKECVEKYGE